MGEVPSSPARAGMAAVMVVMVVMMLTLLLGLQPITTDLCLPALPLLPRELGASLATAQLTLSALIFCFGAGQLVCGPLADRFGRRPVLLAGMALYTAASVFSALSTGIDALVGWRAVQRAAMARAVTRGRSAVRDLFLPHEGARVMSRALTGLGVIAMLCPVVGAALSQGLGWPATLMATALFGAATLAFVAPRFVETVTRRNPQATRLGPLLRNWGVVLRHPTFRARVALLCCTHGGLYFLLAGSSFVFIDVPGSSRLAYGAILATSSMAYIAGTWLCRRLLLRHGLRGAVKRGAWFSLAGGVGMAALGLAGVESVWAIMLPQWLFAIVHGVHQPCGQVGAIGPFPDKAGTAASLSGFAMMLTAFGVSQWLGHTLGHSVLPMTLAIGLFSIMLATVAWTLIQRHGDPAARAAPMAAGAG